jgi:DNA (cytosine-5)-methyltransferase 1
VIQAEILLGRVREIAAKTVWPLLETFASPNVTQANKTKIREISSWINRADHAEKVLETAAWLNANPGSLDSLAGMNSAPNISGSTSAIATHVAPGMDEDPVVTTAGILRVAARFFNTQVDRRNSGTDGRIALARMIGAEDGTSDHAYLALVEISEVICVTSRPACNQCPLQKRCATAL